MLRLFLDANVLFSAAWRGDAGVARLWKLREARLVSSAYAAEEARRNLETDAQRTRLEALLRRVELVPEGAGIELPREVWLREKDRPILLAAISAGATHLVTGDRRDFGPLFGKRVSGVLIVRPAELLAGPHR